MKYKIELNRNGETYTNTTEDINLIKLYVESCLKECRANNDTQQIKIEVIKGETKNETLFNN